jgi:hypothetical protein
MLFGEYQANFDKRKALLNFPPGTHQLGGTCEAKFRPAMPPWLIDWAILYADGNHIRVKEYYVSQGPPNFDHGIRKHFCYQYGLTSGTDSKGMPRTTSDRDTVIRLDRDQWGPHMHYGRRAHVQQDTLSGSFVINDSELFDFIEAVETHRQSGCRFEDILLFELNKVGSK